MTVVLLIVGGVAGALSRFYGTRFVAARVTHSFPLATLLINVSGSFALGVLYGAVGTPPSSGEQHLLLLFGTGFCGAYTTFSSFAFENVVLWRDQHRAAAVANIVVQPMLGLAAAWLGFAAGHWF